MKGKDEGGRMKDEKPSEPGAERSYDSAKGRKT
jgi:hypothetical protein